jgi:xanthine dehydrogenase accessory factor
MRERRRIVDLYQRGAAAALATVVQVEGSSYRSAGARVLIGSNGEYVGAISGGCLEAEVIRKAQWSVRGGAVIERYSTLFDDTTDVPYGLGCGGVVDVLLEPAGTPAFDALMKAMEASLRGETRNIKTALPGGGRALRRTILSASGEVLFSEGAEGSEVFFDEVLEPPQRLIVFGAGDDAQPLVLFASELGWTVWVVDGRSQWAREERFPHAEKVLVARSLEDIGVSPRDAVVLMTHSYEQDRGWLTAVLPHQPRYIGMLGARHRSALLLSEAAAALGWPLGRTCESVFAPIGIDLGGEGAQAIALAIVAEVQAHITGRLPVSRRMTAEMVEQQKYQGDASRYMTTECAL